jgi:hypothetical protein
MRFQVIRKQLIQEPHLRRARATSQRRGAPFATRGEAMQWAKLWDQREVGGNTWHEVMDLSQC